MVASTHLVVIPGGPAVVQELSPHHQPGARFRQHSQALFQDFPEEAVDVVRTPHGSTQHQSFRAWGADVAVTFGSCLPELVASYLLGPRSLLAEARSTITPLSSGRLTIVVLDGSAGLTARAPLALIPEADQAHRWCQDLLGGKCVESVTAQWLSERGVIHPELWVELAALQPACSHHELLIADDSLGVGQYLAHWELKGI